MDGVDWAFAVVVRQFVYQQCADVGRSEMEARQEAAGECWQQEQKTAYEEQLRELAQQLKEKEEEKLAIAEQLQQEREHRQVIEEQQKLQEEKVSELDAKQVWSYQSYTFRDDLTLTDLCHRRHIERLANLCNMCKKSLCWESRLGDEYFSWWYVQHMALAYYIISLYAFV